MFNRDVARTESSVASLMRFLPYLSNQLHRVAAAYSLSLLGVVLALMLPWPLKFMIDGVLTDGGGLVILASFSANQQILLLAASIAVLASTAALVQSFDKILHAKVREQFSLELRDDLVQKLYGLSRDSRQKEMSGELTMRLVSDAQLVSRLFGKTIPLTLKHAVTAVVALSYIFVINLAVGAASTLMACILGGLVFAYGPRLAKAAAEKRNQEGRVSARTQETVNGIEHIQSMALEDSSRERYLNCAASSLRAGVDEIRVAVGLERNSQIVAGVSLALVAGIGGLFVMSGQLTLGALTVCLAYIAQLLKPIEKINEISKSISRGIARAKQINALFDAETTPVSRSGRGLIRKIEIIECQSLAFRYSDSELPAVNNFNHRFMRGECTAIVGPSGCGKSTLLRLILGLQRPTAGRLLANNIAYEELDNHTLRAEFAVLLQDAHLFAGTIREVISEVNADATDDMILNSLHDVHMWHIVNQLPLGLATRIDEAGARFSAGQIARLLLARALISQRAVLLLDEPFANLDEESRQIILRCLHDAKQSRILVIVTHEMNLSGLADHVLVPADYQSTASDPDNLIELPRLLLDNEARLDASA